MTLMNSKFPGLISFMCWVMYDSKANGEFHSNESKAMDEYKLDGGTKGQIIRVGEVHGKPQAREEARKLFADHLLRPFLEIWTAAVESSVSYPSAKPGWLSFMYYVRYDKETNLEFRNKPKDVMARFGIADPAAISKIEQIAKNPQGQGAEGAARAIFTDYIVDELLRATVPRFW